MAAKTRFRGSFTALVTPFKNGSVDEKAFRDFVDWQIAEGTKAWFRSVRRGRARRYPTRNTTRSWNGVSSRPAAGYRS